MRDLLISLGAAEHDADQYDADLEELLPLYGITPPLRLAHFLAQVFHESAYLRFDAENLNYSARALRRVFARYFPTDALAADYARQPERIANRVYANRMGNGNEESGDGWRYRGRGLIQLTGRDNYEAFRRWLDQRATPEPWPDVVATDYAVHSAVFYWDSRGLNALADADDLLAITRRINGGIHGLAHRRELFDRASALLVQHRGMKA